MKAILCKETGTPDVMYIGETPKPIPSSTQVLVKVKATALNRADTLQRQGLYPPPKGESEIMGLEMAGIIEEVGNQITKWKAGDRVFALLAGGGYAEYVTLDEQLLLPIPKNLSFEQAAAVAEVFLTAHQALFWLADLKRDEYVLIHAGASGVGTAAIQLAKLAGAQVIVTAGSSSKLQKCKELGADLAINYKEEDFTEQVKRFTQGKGANVIIDFIGASYDQQNMNSISVDGRWVVLAMLGGRKGELDFAKLLMKRVKLMGSTLRARKLTYKAQLIADFSTRFLPEFVNGNLRPVIDSVFDWENVAEAHHYMEANKNTGKIILKGM